MATTAMQPVRGQNVTAWKPVLTSFWLSSKPDGSKQPRTCSGGLCSVLENRQSVPQIGKKQPQRLPLGESIGDARPASGRGQRAGIFPAEGETSFLSFPSFCEGRGRTGFNSLTAEWGWLSVMGFHLTEGGTDQADNEEWIQVPHTVQWQGKAKDHQGGCPLYGSKRNPGQSLHLPESLFPQP